MIENYEPFLTDEDLNNPENICPWCKKFLLDCTCNMRWEDMFDKY